MAARDGQRPTPLALGAIAIAGLLLPRGAFAAPPRPFDAPSIDARAAVPAPPLEYTANEESGIRIAYHPTARERAHALLRSAATIRAELSNQLGRDVLRAVEIRIAGAPTQMGGLLPSAAPLPAGRPAVAFGDLHLVVMSLGAPGAIEPPPDLARLLGHELAHVALDEALDGHAVPRWFHEGYAVNASGEDAAQRAEALCIASLRDRLMSLHDVDGQFPDGAAEGSLASAEAADFVRFLLERPNRAHFPQLVARVRGGEPFEQAIAAAYGADLGRLEQLWRKEMAKRYSFVPVFAGAMLLWVVIALGVLLRRLRRRRAALAVRRARIVDGERRAPLAASRSGPRSSRAAKVTPEDDELGEPIPPDHEVPRVEHDGRWYTLH